MGMGRRGRSGGLKAGRPVIAGAGRGKGITRDFGVTVAGAAEEEGGAVRWGQPVSEGRGTRAGLGQCR